MKVHNTIMRKAVVKAQETIGANRQKMVERIRSLGRMA